MRTLETLRELVPKLAPYLLLALLPGGFVLAPLWFVLRRGQAPERVVAQTIRERECPNASTW